MPEITREADIPESRRKLLPGAKKANLVFPRNKNQKSKGKSNQAVRSEITSPFSSLS